MITGANTNVTYRGIVFHVQTEDSGRAYPHIISHLYHGGTILASEKTEYAEKVDSQDLETIVRGLIEQQHLEMVRKLQGGRYDSAIEERLGHEAMRPTGALEAPTPAPTAAPEPVQEPAPKAASGAEAPSAAPESEGKRAAAAAATARAFGARVGNQRPLDEMILDYLSEKTRGRFAAGVGSARKPSSGG